MVEKKKKPTDVSRARFLEALEKKKKSSQAGSNVGPSSGSKVGDGELSGGSTKRLPGKSGLG